MKHQTPFRSVPTPKIRSADQTGTSQRRNSRWSWEQGRKELFYPYGKTYAQTICEQD
jgi:hypothetical protein